VSSAVSAKQAAKETAQKKNERKLTVSIVIPTKDRPDELKVTMETVLKQTALDRILELVIVDQSTTDETKRYLEELQKRVPFRIKYVYSNIPSVTRSKNIGLKNSEGDIVLFLDDDVTLAPDFVEKILEVYEKHPEAIGVGGYLVSTRYGRLYRIYARLFLLPHDDKNRARVLPSTFVTYPVGLKDVIRAEWIPGGCSSFRRAIFKEMLFDENFGRRSSKGDVDFAYRLHLKYPGSMFITPHAKMIHRASKKQRLKPYQTIYVREVQTLYFIYKNMLPYEKSAVKRIVYMLAYLWSAIGRVIDPFRVMFFLKSKDKRYAMEAAYTMYAIIYALKNKDKIARGDLSFLNREILGIAG